MDQRCEPHFIHHIHPVAGRRAVRSDGHAHLLFQHLRNLRKSQDTHGRCRIMGNLYIVFLKQVDLLVGQPDCVDCQQVFVQHAQLMKMRHRRLAVNRLGILDLGLGLRHMHMHAHAVLVRQFLRLYDQGVRIVEYGTQAKPHLNPSVRGIVVFVQVVDLLVQLLLHGSLPDLGKSFPAVHHRFCQLRAEPGLGHRPCHAADELPARLREAGHSGPDLLQTAHQRGYIGILLGHIALEGPHPLVQPGHKIHIIPDAPADLLGRMYMRVYKPRKQVLSAQVDDLRVPADLLLIHGSHCADLIPFHQQASMGIHLVRCIHRKNISILKVNLSGISQ